MASGTLAVQGGGPGARPSSSPQHRVYGPLTAVEMLDRLLLEAPGTTGWRLRAGSAGALWGRRRLGLGDGE
ncbi:MAG: hypothetical protein IPK80_35160 [Nannocystis sp.]|nr:hypothetical protein [Nannocystis sp.]